MKIRAVMRYTYGEKLAYVVNKDQERAITKLTGKKTLTPEIVAGLRELGHEVEVIDPYTMEGLE
jgi:hypothetical protein